MTKRRFGVCCMLLGALLLAGALLLLQENRVEESEAGSEAATVLALLQQEMEREDQRLILPQATRETGEYAAATSDETLQTEMLLEDAQLSEAKRDGAEASGETLLSGTPPSETASESRPESIRTNAEISSVRVSDMPELTVGGNQYVGYIELPTLGLTLPVMSDWSYPKLRIAPCRYSGSVSDDTMVILAHNYTRHFGTIKDLEIGDLVQFVDAKGDIYQYTVAKHETLNKKDVDEMVDSDYDLTLFTCTYGGRYRVTVRLNRVHRIA